MKRDRALVAFLAIFLILIVNPSPYSMPLARGIELNEKPFFTAADGDVSSDSITSFGETLADDVLFYPDAFWNGTTGLADWGTAGPDSSENDYTYTHDGTNDEYKGFETTSGTSYVIINFTLPAQSTFESFDYDVYAAGANDDDEANLWVYDWTARDWDLIVNMDVLGQASWYNGTGIAGPYSEDSQFSIMVNSTDADNPSECEIAIAHLTFYVMTLADSDHYAEGFADVSDWDLISGTESFASDGDIVTIHAMATSDNDYEGIQITGLNIPIDDSTVIEWRDISNDTIADYLQYRLYSGTDFYYASPADATNWRTLSYVVKQMSLSGSDFDVIDKIILYARLDDTLNFSWSVDYLRIGPSDEMGWQHDGSTTAGVTNSGDAGVTFTTSTDGDKLTLQALRTSGSGTLIVLFYIAYDTTATSIDIERDYYPFFELSYNATLQGGQTYVAVSWNLDGKYVSNYPNLVEDGIFRTDRINSQAFVQNTANTYASFYANLAATGRGFIVELDYVKAYSIANFTVTQSGAGMDDYLYVDSGVLYSNIDDGYIELGHDPALSVSDTYSVYNLTTSGIAPEFSQYVSEWSAYSDETRGATTSGTVTDIKLKFDSIETISALKFIEDGTAPDILDKFVNPVDPDDDESVTLTAVTYDAIEVYEVTINAVVYPAGFDDVDYDLTEQTDNVLWSYEFSTLTAGYYLFQVTANDGANTYSEYIPVRVRVLAIEITTYTFFGASSDFTYMQYSGVISHDCTYNISEWSDTWAKNETHTGSVTEGMFNIAWDKISVDDAEANFTIVFVSGTLSLTIEGFYGTAYKALQVTEIDFVNLEQSDSWTTNLTINFYTNKEVDWTVYDRDNDDAVLHSGTTTEGDGFITWVQNTARGAHQFAVKWTDSISDQWYNNSYWVFDRNIDDLPGGADPGKDQRRTIEFWSTVAAIAGILGIIVIGLSHYNLDEMIKNLPNYRTQERGRR